VSLLKLIPTSARRRPPRVVLLLLLLLPSLMAIMPPEIPTTQKRVPAGGLGHAVSPSYVCLVVPSFEEPDSFSSFSWPWNWVNLVEQEFACYRVYPSVERALDEKPRVLLLPEGSDLNITPSLKSQLEDWLAGGGILLVERPSDRLEDLAGIVAVADIPAGPPVELQGPLHDPQTAVELSEMPWCTTILDATALGDAEVVMKLGGRPAITVRRVGEGYVVTVLFGLSRQLLALQQGRPTEDFRVPNRRGHPKVFDTPDLVASDEMVRSTTPYADVLERVVLRVLESCLPMPRPWYFPYRYDGVGLMTHDEDWFGDQSLFVSKYEAQQNYSSTFFIIASGPITGDGLEKMRSLGTDLQIHWDREVRRWMVIFKKQDGSLRKQIDVFREKSESSPTLCRIERLRWGRDYTRPFQVMEAQGIALDSSYGPAGHTGKGYLFGTGLPFHPIDTNGLPFELYELPIQVQVRYSGANASFIALLMNQSRSRFHEAIDILYHPADLVEGQPPRYDWLQFAKIARQNNHSPMTMTQFLEWWKKRLLFGIDSLEWNGSTLTFQFSAPDDRCGIFVPLNFSGSLLSEVRIDSKPPKSSRTVVVQGNRYLIFQAERGMHEASIRYG